jgi:chromosome segregation ATPase
MGDTSTRIASLRTYANGSEANIKALEKQIADADQKSSEALQRITSAKKEIEELKLKQSELDKTMEEKKAIANEHYHGLQQFRQSLGQNSKEADGIEQSINKLTQRLIKFDGQSKASIAKIELLENYLQSLASKREEYGALCDTITQRIKQLEEIQQREQASSLNTAKRLREYTDLKAQRAIEIKQAESVSKRANTAFTEIDAQKKIAETLASEDKAIIMLEEMAKAGAIPNVYGRLRRLVKIREEYSKATEAAAAG